MSPYDREQPFKVGDLVRLRNGWTAMQVLEIDEMGWVVATYTPHLTELYVNDPEEAARYGGLKRRVPAEFVRWDPRDPAAKTNRFETEGDTPMNQQLYTWTQPADGSQPFGYKIGENSKGQWVMEPKGGGAPVLMDRKDVTEVLPYTIAADQIGQRTTAYFRVNPDDGLVVGDMVLTNDGEFFRVTKLDVKRRGNVERLYGIKIAGTPLTSVE